MKTSQLIGMLATGAGPAPRALPVRRLIPAALAGVLVSGALAVSMFSLVPASMFGDVSLWVKFVYGSLLAAAAGWLVACSSRPASPTRAPWLCATAVVGAMLLLGTVALAQVPPGTRLAYLLGRSWMMCPWSVLALSAPALAGVLWALRGLAPTDARAAGFAAGMLAGSLGALGYSLVCPEESFAFVAIWYTLGILFTAFAGTALGPRVLRW